MFVHKIMRDAIKFRPATIILLIKVLLQFRAVGASLSVQPRDITAKVGANIDFQCNTMSTSDTLVWKKYGPQRATLYDGSSVPDPRKFSANKNGNAYSLTVFNVSHTDGATYSFTTSSDNSEVFANLLVVANPVLSMSPSSGLQVGTVLNLTCSLVYGGPSTDYDKVRALSSTQDPQISITVGSFTYNQSWHGPLVYQDYVTADNVTSVRSLSVNITLQAADAGSFATCSVQSTKPSYLDSATQLIPLTGGPTLITINGSNDANYTRGTFINCTANGNPFPTVSWRRNSPSGCTTNTGPQGPGYAVLNVSCSGSNTWNCSASNSLGAIWRPLSFTTVADSSSSMNSTFLEAPSDVTAKAGSPATFQCSLPVGAKVNWFRYNPGRVLIFDGSTNTIQTVPCPSCDVEATADGSYNFTIGTTDVSDGGTYSWETSSATVYANLVVIGDIKISVYPSSPSVDDIVTLTCTAICGVPSGSSPLEPISNDQQPRYNLLIQGGSTINSTVIQSPPLSERNQFLDVVTSSTIVTKKIDKSDKGKNITCQVSTDIPAFSVSITQELSVQDVVSGSSSVFSRDSSFILAATIFIICFIRRL